MSELPLAIIILAAAVGIILWIILDDPLGGGFA